MVALPEPAASSRAPVRIGRYLVFEEFARGGQATVHLGRLEGPVGFSRIVAVKRLQPSLAESDDHARSLLDEARLTARIRHPNVVQTIDVVDTEGRLFVVMEYVHGVTLSRLLAAAENSGTRMPIDVAVGIVAGALQGLQAAHEAKDEQGAPLGIVHRDVSPHNIQVGADGVARILDFGIAKSLKRAQVTTQGEVKGKLAYMPREQLSGQPLTRQADLYAMGVVLWEAVTGKRLFDESDPARLAVRVLTESVPPPSEHATSIPASLDAIVLRATSHDTRRRFATADEMLAELVEAAPRAEATAIATWVQDTAGDELDVRAERVRAVDGYVASPSDAAIGAMNGRASDPAPVVVHQARKRTARRAAFFPAAVPIAAIASLVAMMVAGVSAHPRRDPSAPSSNAGAPLDPAPLAAVGSASPPLGSASEAIPAPSPDEADNLDPDIVMELDDQVAQHGRDGSSAKTSLAPPGTRPPRVKRRAPSSSGSRETRANAAACDPPYSIDANGWKHYKPRCLP